MRLLGFVILLDANLNRIQQNEKGFELGQTSDYRKESSGAPPQGVRAVNPLGANVDGLFLRSNPLDEPLESVNIPVRNEAQHLGRRIFYIGATITSICRWRSASTKSFGAEASVTIASMQSRPQSGETD